MLGGECWRLREGKWGGRELEKKGVERTQVHSSRKEYIVFFHLVENGSSPFSTFPWGQTQESRHVEPNVPDTSIKKLAHAWISKSMRKK